MTEPIEEAPELTDEDEKILDKIWAEIAQEEEQKEKWGKNPPQKRG